MLMGLKTLHVLLWYRAVSFGVRSGLSVCIIGTKRRDVTEPNDVDVTLRLTVGYTPL